MSENNKPNSSRGKTFLKVIWLCMLMSLISGFVSFGYVTGLFGEPEPETITIDVENSMEIEIPRGASTNDIVGILEKKEVVKYPSIYKVMSKLKGYDGTYRSGTHVISSNLGYESIMRVLTGSPKNMAVTIPEGYSFKQIEELLVSKKLINRKNFVKLSETEELDYEFLRGLPKTKYRLEGYLFPDTYFFDLKTPDKQILNSMLNNFDEKIMPEHYKRASALDMSMHEIITLASLVEREAKFPNERKTIAGVFYNRLKTKNQSLKRLQSCATIQYLYYLDTGEVKESITTEDTRIKDEYNTYIHSGLPPGPICMPGMDAIEAALDPQKHEFLYFVAKGTSGEHYFSKTLAEHNNAVKKYGAN